MEGAWQLTQQFPSSFEFNERFLITLHDHVYSAQFGTYIGNCERDRRDLNVAQTTYSLWGYLANNADAYRNPLYQPELDGGGLLEPCLNPQAIRYWRGMYNRFELGVHPREQTGDLLAALKDHSTSMRDHADYLRQVGSVATHFRGAQIGKCSKGKENGRQKRSIHRTKYNLGEELTQFVIYAHPRLVDYGIDVLYCPI